MQSTLSTRRLVTATLAAIPTALAAGSALGASDAMEPAAKQAEGISRNAAAIHQEVVFQAHRDRVYQTLTNAERFDRVIRLSAAATSVDKPGAPATRIEGQAGGAFTLFGGYITGRQIELVPSERIVQVWRSASWAPGAFSLVRFVLRDEGAGTRLVFDHRGFPDDQAEHLASGWHLNYWDPIAKVLAQG